ncbi:uncharacterized protein [Antedon mediterranea]|uniref:uncharacterized protein n=1 Tax=Antedon mediterranea TaxID=105859 RepID=UPI003AF833CB
MLCSSLICHNIRLTVPQNIVNKMEKSPSQLNNWNPMKDEFNDDKFNSYETGLPGNMSAKKGNQEYDRLVRHTGFQFYVSGIPKQMTQEGLTNLFSRAGKVVSCKICKSDRQDTETTFGFVGMSTVSELSKAHTQLNNYQVGSQTLKLRVARDTEMYLKNEGSDNAFHFSGGESQSSSRSPRRMDNRYGSREMSSSDRSDVDHAREETKRDAQPNLKKTFSFKSQGAMLIQVRVESNQRKVRMSDKPLVLKTDNAQFSGTLNDTVVNVHSTGLNLGELEAEDLKNVSAQIQRSRHSSLDQKEVQPSENVSVVDTSVSKGQQEVVSKSQHFDGAGTTTIAPCLNCGRPGMRCCSACKSKYCTQACQQKHWPSHKLHCKSIQARLEAFGGFAKKDSYIYLKDLDYFQPEKQELQALAIHLVSPDEIWIQLMQTKSKEYFSLICSMTDIYNAMDNSSPYKPKVGTLCAATTDEEWYRGTILEIKEDNIVSVRLIDYGDIRDIHPKDLRHLTQQFSKTPILASPCKLVDIEPIDGKWSTEACDYLVSMLVNKQCKVNLKKIENGIYPATITMTQGKEGNV